MQVRLGMLGRILFPLLIIALSGNHALIAKKTDYTADDPGTAPRKNDLSSQRIIELRDQLLSREIVARVNWRANHIVHDSLAIHSSQSYASGQKKANKQALDFGLLQTPAGEVSVIYGMNFQHPTDSYLFARTSRGTKYTITVRAPLRSKNRFQTLSDEWLTPQWLEQQIANQAFRFLPKASSTARRNTLNLKRPASRGLTLSLPVNNDAPPLSDQPAAQSSFPSYLSALRIEASPNRVRRGSEVLLVLEYAIEGQENSSTVAIETRQLSKDGKQLPGYPIVKEFQREIGSESSVYKQRIPSNALSGEYIFEGQVCINGECISRIVSFTIE
ncbi:MAG: hypothetical protein AAGB46_15115 [Verrucomicrobiota bacterium]